jgi:4'-phosphopantetheinyl transferase
MRHRHSDRRPGLSSGEIHVWTASLVDDRRAAAPFLRILSREEQTRAERLSFERDRVRFIQSHGVVRQILADYCNADAASLTFVRNRHGKPSLVSRANDSHFQFSVSHSGNCCMLAVRLEHALGIDIEKVRDLSQSLDIVRGYFTPAEGSALAALQGTARRDAFFALWTHKEAMVKGLGVSLAANLGRVAFDLDPIAGPRLVAWAGDRSIGQRWSIVRFDAAPGYAAALASVHPIGSLRVRNWNRAGAD